MDDPLVCVVDDDDAVRLSTSLLIETLGLPVLTGTLQQAALPAASVDIVTSVFLFHELPPQVRRAVTAEVAPSPWSP